MNIRKEALAYHSGKRKGKIEVVPSKPCSTQRDLSLAYTPGVAQPCLDIHDNPENAYNYTTKGNLVAVVSNGTAVLGLGNIGALAGKPVMEGKGVLFKRFADIDVFDIELNTENPDEIIKAVQLLEPTFGGVNLEDIKAPECFYIEETLKKSTNIPIFHDDQHGTAIISGAALINALEIVGKDISQIKVVVNGAGAAGIACAKLYVSLGVKLENVMMCDSKGVIYKGREAGMNPYKAQFAIDTNQRTLADAMKGADVFAGVSVANCVTQDMVRSMADKPIIFAMANPDPEITYEDAKAARSDLIMATGRSDYPNQVNNVLGFPFIFRGALDVRASAINDEMKIAATMSLAKLAKEDVPDSVCRAYGVDRLAFGPEYIIPKPFDPRVLLWEAPAVAKAAMETGVAKIQIDLDDYREKLEARLGKSREVMRMVIHKAQRCPLRVVYTEGEDPKILRAVNIVLEEKIAHPILLGRSEVIHQRLDELKIDIDLKQVAIINPTESENFNKYCDEHFKLRQRKGRIYWHSQQLMALPRVFGPMMVHMGEADCTIGGLTSHYPEIIRPALRIIQSPSEVRKVVAGMYILLFKNKLVCMADTTVNVDPNPEELADIAILTADTAKRFEIDPKIAMLSFSNFGSSEHSTTLKVKKATEIVKQKRPDLIIDGEMQANTALNAKILKRDFPFSKLQESANVLIFPNLDAGNIAYKLLIQLGGAEAIGPILMGLEKSVHVLQRGSDVNDVVNMTAIGVVEAQEIQSRASKENPNIKPRPCSN